MSPQRGKREVTEGGDLSSVASRRSPVFILQSSAEVVKLWADTHLFV
jgi:hypothetical protein